VDGAVIALRRLTLADAADVVRLYETLSDDECYYRFFTAHPAHLKTSALSLSEASQTQYALGAFASRKLLGVASYIEIATESAEVAVVVAHSEHLRGVGTALLRRLGEIAKANGVHHLIAEVLAENHLMQRVLADSGWPCSRHLDGAVLHVDIDLDAVTKVGTSPQVSGEPSSRVTTSDRSRRGVDGNGSALTGAQPMRSNICG
jgi:L-amino acid N-acyltransferase YncA